MPRIMYMSGDNNKTKQNKNLHLFSLGYYQKDAIEGPKKKTQLVQGHRAHER